MTVKRVQYFVTENGVSPFENWFNKLDDVTQAIVVRNIQRFAQGGAKKSIRALRDGIFEIKIPYGPGYRVYFTKLEKDLILLLIGGDKKSQNRDIAKAKKHWRNYGK
ncbi:MAG: type II toxin-antitoxin system RelE/ParE family toxin [Bdellovibrionales bacterium]|nr:type II toxin-antitoxin system RelE/ParE family toxin [Bdellovibrionales bacterium]